MLRYTHAGCNIYGYDHTVEEEKIKPDNFFIEQLGITKLDSETRWLKSLQTFMAKNGHDSNTVITYMKVKYSSIIKYIR